MMKTKWLPVVALWGAAAGWWLTGAVMPGVAGDQQPTKDSPGAQLYVRLLGTSG